MKETKKMNLMMNLKLKKLYMMMSIGIIMIICSMKASIAKTEPYS